MSTSPSAPRLSGSVVSIGAFDGVHRGHQSLLRALVSQSRQLGVPAVVYTFDPPPRVALLGVPQLTSLQEKVNRLRGCGVDLVIVAPFDQRYRQRDAHEFIAELERLSPLCVHVGEDFRFGHGRAGDLKLLRRSFHVEPIQPVRCPEGELISSTRVRNLLAAGEFAEAQSLLGWA